MKINLHVPPSLFLCVLLLLLKFKNGERKKKSSPHHSFIPDESHPLLHSIDTLWDLSEVILANGLLGHAEGTVSTASHTQVSTGRQRNMKIQS